MEEKVTIQEARREYKATGGKIINDDIDGFVVLKNINKIYGNHVQAVYDFNLSIKPQEFIVLVGPSGCGKSTTLRMIAGLEEISSGYLYIDKVIANHLESKDRNIAMVFQSYALYPNMTVYDNIAFGLKIRKLPKEEIQKRVFNAAEILDLGPYLDRKPKELSGGQMQRVALGRAIVRDAKVFLMDEPLSNLDAKLRVQTRSKIVKIHKSIHATTIYVTHDQTEAMTMADRIVVMNKGFIQQVGTPKEIYSNPKNLFVATFIGTPPMNVFEANLNKNIVTKGNESFTIPPSLKKAFIAYRKKKAESMKTLEDCADLSKENEIEKELESGVNKESVIKELEDLSLNRPLFASVYSNVISILKDDSVKEKIAYRKANKELKEVRYILESEIKRLESSLKTSFAKKETSVLEAPKKKHFFFFQKKEKESTSSLPTLEETKAKFARLRKIYEEKAEIETCYFGIRPENVHLKEDNFPNVSESLPTEITFFELLGSEYLVDFNLFGTNITMKLPNTKEVYIGKKIEVCFDLNALKLFDKESGENVLWKEND